MSQQFRICIRAEANDPSRMRLVEILECLFPVRFSFSTGCDDAGKVCEVVFEDQTNIERQNGEANSCRLTISRNCASRLGKNLDIAVEFSGDPDVPFPFRHRSLRTKIGAEVEPLVLAGGEKVLAATEHGPVWVVSVQGRARHFRSSFPLPVIPSDGNLRSVFSGDRFIEMLPLVQFIREISASTVFEGPSLMACFMFDDPNLHWPNYGYVDYGEIAKKAARGNYHVSFATIPLDTWFTHRAAAELFKRYPEQISLLIHGNDHTKKEFVQRANVAARVSILKQVIHRIERLERASGLKVSRVLAPPHGACSDLVLEELPMHGFDAATISHGSLCAHNKNKDWTRSLGYLPSELIRGCPVLPRWGISGETENTILLAAYLKQPIILMGHHQDLRHGIDLLDQRARFINGLGGVRWSNTTDLTRASYLWRVDGETLTVRPLCRAVNVHVTSHARRLVIENPFKSALKAWHISGAQGEPLWLQSGQQLLLPEGFEGRISIEGELDSRASDNGDSAAHRSTAWAVCRRLLTEGRDRFRIAV